MRARSQAHTSMRCLDVHCTAVAHTAGSGRAEQPRRDRRWHPSGAVHAGEGARPGQCYRALLCPDRCALASLTPVRVARELLSPRPFTRHAHLRFDHALTRSLLQYFISSARNLVMHTHTHTRARKWIISAVSNQVSHKKYVVCRAAAICMTT